MTKYIYKSKTRTFEKMPAYIYQRQNGWYEIRKRVGGHLLYWGSYPTLEEAMLHRAYYIGKKWDVTPAFKAKRHIIEKGNRYIILKKVGDHNISYGTFTNLHDAMRERDICVACNWDFDEIVEWED